MTIRTFLRLNQPEFAFLGSATIIYAFGLLGGLSILLVLLVMLLFSRYNENWYRIALFGSLPVLALLLFFTT